MEQKIKKWKHSFKYTLTCPLYTTEHMEGMAGIAMIINTESREREKKPSIAGFRDILLTHYAKLQKMKNYRIAMKKMGKVTPSYVSEEKHIIHI